LTYSDSEPSSAAKKPQNIDLYRNKEVSKSETVDGNDIVTGKHDFEVEIDNPCDISFASSNSISFERGRFVELPSESSVDFSAFTPREAVSL